MPYYSKAYNSPTS